MILSTDPPDFEFSYHPRYLQALLDYRDLCGGRLPFDWSNPESINDELLRELRDYEHYLKYRRADLKRRRDYG